VKPVDPREEEEEVDDEEAEDSWVSESDVRLLPFEEAATLSMELLIVVCAVTLGAAAKIVVEPNTVVMADPSEKTVETTWSVAR
jgi:hypothetical protein